jgi:nicotinate-nucleotide adenylyltransferase
MVFQLEELKFLPENISRVGILGGSFDPAHSGHVYISLQAIELLNLDFVVWLISPQNPLKSALSSSIEDRIIYCKVLINEIDKIIISDIERYLPTNYTSDTIGVIKTLYPEVNFVWLMGADNMIQIHKWHHWHDIFNQVFVAVFDRDQFADRVLESEAAKCYKLVDERLISNYSDFPKGSWCFFRIPKSKMSSTLLRTFNISQQNFTNMQMANALKLDYSIDQTRDIILSSLDNDQADNIVLCDLIGKASFARYMVIVSGRNNRHVVSMVENLMQKLKSINISSHAIGLTEGNWVLLDVEDIIVNVFMPEYREMYNLEGLWSNNK